MKISREKLMGESRSTGFRPEMLEKVFHLLNLLAGSSNIFVFGIEQVIEP